LQASLSKDLEKAQQDILVANQRVILASLFLNVTSPCFHSMSLNSLCCLT
jgi:hypothetical protein